LTYEQIITEIKQYYIDTDHQHEPKGPKEHILAMSNDQQIDTTAKYIASFGGELVIDIGCGRNPYKSAVPNLIGFDIRSDIKGPDYVKSVEQMAKEDIIKKQSVDVAYASGTILSIGPKEHIETNLQYISSWLKSGGVFITKLRRAIPEAIANEHGYDFFDKTSNKNEHVIWQDLPNGKFISGFKIQQSSDNNLFSYMWTEEDFDILPAKYDLVIEKKHNFWKDKNLKKSRAIVLFRKK